MGSSEQLEALSRAARNAPKDAARWLRLGIAQREVGEVEQAAKSLMRALTLRPAWVEAGYQLGLTLEALGELDGAVECFERAAQLDPKRFDVKRRLAFAYVRKGDPARAVNHYEAALALNSQAVDVLLELAAVHGALGRQDSASACYRRALAVDPGRSDVRVTLGNALYQQGLLDEAIAEYRRAIEHDPSAASAHANLGSALKDIGLLPEAVASYRRALELDPANAVIHGNLLFTLSYHPELGPAEILDEARSFAERHTVPLRDSRRPHDNPRSLDRKLRIGYVSSDFREHVSVYYLDSLLRHHDRDSFEIYAYASVFPPDAWTRRYSTLVARFRDVWSLDDVAVAELIRSDGIDVLVDLTMHSSHARPLIFARKPAPVQLCWLAYAGTTGNDAMDYRITDPHLDPPELVEPAYTERPLHLPSCFWCYEPMSSGIDVGPLPALATGRLTFGCLGNFCKVSDGTLQLWANVMRRVSGSRLLLHAPSGQARLRSLEVLGRAGVEPAAVTFVDRRPRPEYLELYRSIDVCLDTLPYNGLSNSLDAAWMGVPTLTLQGATVVGRAGSSVASNLGLPELVARTPDELVQAAAVLCADLPALAALRRGLRGRLQLSPLMDAARFARDMEAAYRSIWRDWVTRMEIAAS